MSGNIDYIPYHKALVLEGQTEEEELKKELEQLQSNLVLRLDALEVCSKFYT